MAISAAVISVFGSSRPGSSDPEYHVAYEVGRELSGVGYVVCNGGYGGTMEASARGAKESAVSPLPRGEQTIGVVARTLGGLSPNRWIDRTIMVETMVERLLKLIELGDAYVVLKGGTGTLFEFSAVWEFMNKNVIAEKPIVVVGNFWDGVIGTLRHELAWEGKSQCTAYVASAATPVDCANIIRSRLQHRDT